ncbi:MAG: cell division protein FtsL [Pseudomonadota bacterium]
MTRFGLAFGFLSMILVAIWAYNVTYQTRQAFDRLSDLRTSIADEGEAVQVLRVEWAWLNAPHRLKRLVRRNNERLRLVRLAPERFGFASSVPFPPNTFFDPAEAILAAGEIVAPSPSGPPLSMPQPVARPSRLPDLQSVSLGQE